jgi:hypothetical protein
MLVKINDKLYAIDFSYQDFPCIKISKDNFGRHVETTWFERYTACKITPMDDKETFYSATSRCFYKDHFVKATGRLNSLNTVVLSIINKRPEMFNDPNSLNVIVNRYNEIFKNKIGRSKRYPNTFVPIYSEHLVK